MTPVTDLLLAFPVLVTEIGYWPIEKFGDVSLLCVIHVIQTQTRGLGGGFSAFTGTK